MSRPLEPPSSRRHPGTLPGLRRHWPLVAVLALGGLHRLAVAHAYPVFVFPDSQVYQRLADPPGGGIGFSPGRPSGYPVVLRLVSALAGPELGNVTTLQHLAGLAVGALVYALLVRLRAPVWVAALGAAAVLLDGYVVALEHDLLADSLFGAAVFVALFLAVSAGRRPALLALGGLALGSSVLLRSAGFFVVPVWLLYLAIARRGWMTAVAGVAGLAAPVLAYCLAHQAAGGGFAITHSDGWFLYGRIAAIARCDGVEVPPATRPLCGGPPLGPVAAVWDGRSAARQLFAPGPAPPIGEDYPQGMTAESNALLRRWSVAVIMEHPRPYLALVASDFLQYFRSGERGVVAEVNLPGEPSPWLTYSRSVHTIRWLAGLLLVLGLARFALALAWGRARAGPWREVGLLALSALGLLVGPVATTDLNLRYMVPALAPLTCAGLLVAIELTRGTAARLGTRRRPVSAPRRHPG